MDEVVLISYGFFCGYSLLLVVLLFVRHENSGNKLLSFVLLLLLGRVGKSVISLAFPGAILPVNVVGLASMAALGPMMLFYVEELYTGSRIPRRKAAIHLIPAVACLLVWDWTLLNPAYFVITAHFLGYIFYTAGWLFANREIYAIDNIRWRWSKGVITGIFIMSISFATQLFIYEPVLYLGNIGISVGVLYLLSFWAMRQNRLFVELAKKSVDDSTEVYAKLGEAVKKVMDEEAFVDSDLNLGKLARNLKVQPYILSRTVNIYFNKSFPELILDYRLRKAEQLLSSLGKVYTIEAIAYESGFNTLSVFYQSFKKRNGMTPAQYKKHLEDKT